MPAAQQSVHPIPEEHRGYIGGSRRVFKLFVWLQAGSVKMAFSHPTHQYPEGA
jgi:hypothetical protein